MRLSLVFCFFYFGATAQEITVLSIQKEWDNQQITNVIYLVIPQIYQDDSLTLSITKQDQTLFKKFNLPANHSFYQVSFQSNFSDAHLQASITGQNKPEIPFALTNYTIFHDSLVMYSPILSYKKSQQQLIPSPYFNVEEDTLIFDFTLQFLTKKPKDKTGFEFQIFSSNLDTVFTQFYKTDNLLTEKFRISILGSKLGTGKFFAQIHFIQNNRKMTSAKSNDFFLTSNSSLLRGKGNLISPPVSLYYQLFSSYASNECDELMKKVYFMTTPEEQQLYNKLKDIESKRQFLAAYWEKRDKISGQNFNEVLEKISYSNTHFSIAGKPGYLTDKGRIFLKYGLCEDIFISSNSLGTKPFEVWYYPNIENGAKFYFVDLNGFGEMKLIHSTAKNEISNLGYLLRLGIDPNDYRQQ